MRRLLAVCTALVLVLPAQAATAASPKAPSPVTDLAPYELSGPVHLQWTNPKGIDRVVARLARGSAAPTTPDRGRKIDLARTAHTATLRGLRPGTEYSVSVWTRRAGALSRPTKISFATKPTHRAANTATGTISGVVTDTAGHPLRSVSIDAFADDIDGSDHSASTDADGRFRLSAPAGAYTVYADGTFATGGNTDATGYLAVIRTVVVKPHQSQSVHLALRGAGAVTGTVTDAAGHPVRGVVVTAQNPQPYLQPSFGFGSTFFGGGSATSTDRNGSYTLRGLDSNAVVPCFSGAGYRSQCSSGSVATAPGHTTTAATIALTKVTSGTGTIFGRISAASGRPLRGVGFVDVFSNRGGEAAFLPIFRDGRFTASGLAPGRWHVCAAATTGGPLGLQPKCVLRTVTAGRRTGASLKLKTGGALSGRAVGPSGLGVPNALVGVSVGREFSEQVPTDHHGYFSLAGLPSGNYRLCFIGHNSAVRGDATGVAGGCLKRRVAAEAGRDRIGVDHTMPAGGAATGRITNGVGHPLSGVDVFLQAVGNTPNGSYADVTTGSDGRYHVTDLAPGRYQACADRTVAVYATDESRCLRRPVTITAAHTVRGLDLRLLSPALIHVRVTDASGHPLSGVEVAALRTCTNQFACPPQPIFGKHRVGVDSVNMTNGRGRATIAVTRSTKYAVCALGYYAARVAGTSPTGYADKCGSSTYSIAASPSHPGSATIALDPGAAVTGRVINGAGHGIRNAEMHISGSPADDITTSSPAFVDPSDGPQPSPFADNLTDTSGRYAIHSIRPGQAQVCARNAKGYENGCLSGDLSLSGGSTTTAPDLTLPPRVASMPRAAAAVPAARRPDWTELVVGGHVIERRPVSARRAPFASPWTSPWASPLASRWALPFGSPFARAREEALTTQLALAGDLRRFGS